MSKCRLDATRASLVGVAVVAVVLVATMSPATATWSIVAVDPETGDVGVAIASCVPAVLLGDLDQPLEPVVIVPGVGAGVSQALLNSQAPSEIRRQLEATVPPSAIVEALMDSAFDDQSSQRQHAVVAVSGDSAAATGDANVAGALDAQGRSVSAQGNILVSPAVVYDAVGAFETTSGHLAERLVAALVAGGDAGGDSRCADQTALFAQVVVAEPDDAADAPSVLLTVAVVEGDGQNPVTVLADAFAEGRRQYAVGPSVLRTYGLLALAGLGLLVVIVVGVVLGIRQRRAGSSRS